MQILNMANVQACPDVLAPLDAVGRVVSLPPDREVLRERIGDFDVYVASLEVRLDADVLRRADRLRVIATPTTGLDHLDLDAAAQRDITIISLRDDTEFLSNLTATAELAWGLYDPRARRPSHELWRMTDFKRTRTSSSPARPSCIAARSSTT